GEFAKKAYPTGTFPKKLEPGEPYKYDVEMEDIYPGVIDKLERSDYLRVAIKDAKDKYHYSKKLKISDLRVLKATAEVRNQEQG
ncbi:hypothetical protein, partial [Halocola ammonii]